MIDPIPSSGQIIAIFVAPTKHARQLAADAVQLKTAKGIVGDRFFGFRQKHRGRNITLIEAETLDNFNRNYGQTISLDATRRNLLTRGIRLNPLVGKIFYVGDVLCKGVELCEPCGILARHIANATLTHAEIIKAFTHRGGLRAEVLSDGVVRLGDRCKAADN